MTPYPSNMDAHGPMRSEEQAREDVLAEMRKELWHGWITPGQAMMRLCRKGWTVSEAYEAIGTEPSDAALPAALREGGE